MAKRLYVGNLPYTISEPQLRDLFSQAGEIESVTVIMDRETGKTKGFAFVEMVSDEDAQKAIEKFDKYQIGDRPLVVNEARPKEERNGNYKGGRANRSGFKYR